MKWDNIMNIIVAKSGFCFAIKRAYQEIDKLISCGQKVAVCCTHNDHAKNTDWDILHRVETADPELFKHYPNLRHVNLLNDYIDVPSGTHLAIGHRDIPLKIKTELEQRNIVIHSVNCQFMVKMDKTANELTEKGYDLIVFGKPENKHCMYALNAASKHGRHSLIAEEVAQIQDDIIQPDRSWACIAQTTGKAQVWQKFIEELRQVDPSVRVVDTICTDCKKRFEEAADLAGQADIVIVVDDGGGVSTSVYETCLVVNRNTVKYDTKKPLDNALLAAAQNVAIVGGILVPEWILHSVAADISHQFSTVN